MRSVPGGFHIYQQVNLEAGVCLGRAIYANIQ